MFNWTGDRRVTHWARHGGSTLGDQGAASAAQFIVSILAARWLTFEEYGAYGVAFAVFLFVLTFHSAVLTEPLLVFGAGKYRENLWSYVTIILRGHLIWSLGIIMAGALIGVLFLAAGSRLMGTTFLALGLATPGWLLLWLTRRAYHAAQLPNGAAAVSLTYLVLSVGSVWALHSAGSLTVATLLIAIGGSSLISSLWLLGLRNAQSDEHEQPTTSRAFRDLLHYGRWNALAALVYWTSGQSLNMLIPVVIGLEANALFVATQNLYRPLHLASQSMPLLLLPALSKTLTKETQPEELRRWVLRVVVVVSIALILYTLAVAILADPLFRLLYAGKYTADVLLILLLGVAYSTSGGIQIINLVHKAAGNTREVTRNWVLSSIILIPLAIPAMLLGGLPGGIAVMALSYGVAEVVGWRRIRQLKSFAGIAASPLPSEPRKVYPNSE